VRIITDPYEPGGYNGAIGYGPIPDEADVVTVSHEHGDHNYVAGVGGNPLVIKGPGSHQAKGLIFTGVATHHDDSQGSERGANTVFIFEVDGLRICHLGDLGHVLTPEQVAQIGAVDVLLLPVGGRATVDANAATQVMEQLSPRVTIPMHYKTDKVGFPFDSVDEFVRGKYGVRRLGAAQLELSKEGMPPRPEIMVLRPAL